MMNYEEFKEEVIKSFKSYLPDPMQEMKLVVNQVNKVNVTKDSIWLAGQGTGVSLTTYINDIYERYLESGDFDKTMQEVAKDYMDEYNKMPKFDVEQIIKGDDANIIYQLVNTEQNEELLKKVPHRAFLDLSIIYKQIINIEKDGGIYSATITNDLAGIRGLTEEQLYDFACTNTEEILLPEIKDMNDMVPEEIRNPYPMYVLRNGEMLGASIIINNSHLEVLADGLDSDLYILPSSIHEVIAIPVVTDGMSVEEMKEMVRNTNDTVVMPEERLSYSVYRYNRETKELEIA